MSMSSADHSPALAESAAANLAPLSSAGALILRAELSKTVPDVSEAQWAALWPADVAVFMREARCFTSGGTRQIYTIATPPTPLGFVMHSDCGRLVVPSLYVLYVAPKALPRLKIQPCVLEFLRAGEKMRMEHAVFKKKKADLEPNWAETNFGSFSKGDIIAVFEKDSWAPCAIARWTVSSAELSLKDSSYCALEVLHIVDDEVWNMGSCTIPVQDPTLVALGSQEQSSAASQVAVNKSSDATSNGGGAVACLPEMLSPSAMIRMDTRLKHSFLLALCEAPPLANMLATTFYPLYVVPNSKRLRANGDINLKQTRWKKFRVFLKDMEETGLVHLGPSQSDVQIVSFDASHALLQEFKKGDFVGPPYDSDSVSSGQAANYAAAPENAGSTRIKVQELLKKGNKYVTEVDNLSAFGIMCDDSLRSELGALFGCSVSTQGEPTAPMGLKLVIHSHVGVKFCKWLKAKFGLEVLPAKKS